MRTLVSIGFVIALLSWSAGTVGASHPPSFLLPQPAVPPAIRLPLSGMPFGQHPHADGASWSAGTVGASPRTFLPPQRAGAAQSVHMTASNTEQVLHSFAGGADGAQPLGGLIDVNGVFYGTTAGGTVFELTKAGTEKPLYSFAGGTDGALPTAGLVYANGVLYGTTWYGGQYGPYNGTVFAVTLAGTERVLYSFSSGQTTLPRAGLVYANGVLYGTTEGGADHGSVFAVTPAGTERVLYSFTGGTDGGDPYGGLIDVNGVLYGTTRYGGQYGQGTVFAVTLAGTERVLYSFTGGTDGRMPMAGLIDVNGVLYGTTSSGGQYGAGTVFAVYIRSGSERVLHSFGSGADGASPWAGLIDVNGVLYGTTWRGGQYEQGPYTGGTVFAVNTTSGSEQVLHSFGSGTDGAQPQAGLIDVNGVLYGTTQYGGQYGQGTVFALSRLIGPPKDPLGHWGPTALANTFQYPVQSGYDGTGTTVAILADSYVLPSDINTYTHYFQTPATARKITPVLVDGSTSDPVPGLPQDEVTLDVETIAGLAPGANVIVYVIPSESSNQQIVDGLAQINSDGKANIVSMSFGKCEASDEITGMSNLFQTGVNAGRTFVTGSGDWGTECPNENGTGLQPGAVYPASDPNVVGVGGNESLTALANPVAWDDNLDPQEGPRSTGGGFSAFFTPLPAYQSGIAGLASPLYRNVPDIALPAVQGSAYIAGKWWSWGVYGGVNVGVDGTSWSAPAAAAMLAEIAQYCNHNLGNANVLLYQAFRTAPSADFIDVTSGSNELPGVTQWYSAKPGYDNTTGLGMPLGTPLAQTLCPNHTLASIGNTETIAQSSGRRTAKAYTMEVRPLVRGLQDLGRRAATATSRIQIVLRPSNTLASDEAQVINVLRKAGLTIVKTFRNHLVVDAEGPSSAVERLFNTTIHNINQTTHGARYAPTQPATIPTSLAPYLSGVSLDNLVTFHHLRQNTSNARSGR
jgi:uncharacterized repeat protein (TIGR03803 family)